MIEVGVGEKQDDGELVEGVCARSNEDKSLSKVEDTVFSEEGEVTVKGDVVVSSDETEKQDAEDGGIENARTADAAHEDASASILPTKHSGLNENVDNSINQNGHDREEKSTKRKRRKKKGKSAKRKKKGKSAKRKSRSRKEKSSRSSRSESQSQDTKKRKENSSSDKTGHIDIIEIVKVTADDLQEDIDLDESDTNFALNQIATNSEGESGIIDDTSVTMTDFDHEDEDLMLLKSSLEKAEKGSYHDSKQGVDIDSKRGNTKSTPGPPKTRKKKKKKGKRKKKKSIEDIWIAGAEADLCAHRENELEIAFQEESSFDSGSEAPSSLYGDATIKSHASSVSAFRSLKSDRVIHVRRTTTDGEDTVDLAWKRVSNSSLNSGSNNTTLRTRSSIRKDLEAQVKIDVAERKIKATARKSFLTSEIFKSARRSQKIFDEVEIDLEVANGDGDEGDDNDKIGERGDIEEPKLLPYLKEKLCTRKVCKPLMISLSVTVGIVIMLILATN